MLDIKKIKNNPDFIKNALKNRSNNYDGVIDELLNTDALRCDLISKTESMKSTQNSISKKIPLMKKNNEDVTCILAEMKELSDKITAQEAELAALEEKQQKILLSIPNVPHESAPKGKSDCDNIEMRKWGDPVKFDFEPIAHWEIGKKLDILDSERAAKVTGSRFHFYKGLGAKLERALINFFLDIHTQNGYTEILPPFMVNRDSMTGTGQLPKFEEDAFKLANAPYFMVPTAEVPVTNMHRDEILSSKDLPIKYCAYSVCFRAEAGSAGRDTRGIIRQHQFNKVELVKLCRPEDSYNELELITKDAEKILQLLKLPYRVVCLCTGDLGFCSAKTYDIEVWMPSYNRYVEISSCSNFEDYQARRMKIRYKENPTDKAKFVHTLNGSGLAVGRTVAAILENYQNSDGSITVPHALKNYLGADIIK